MKLTALLLLVAFTVAAAIAQDSGAVARTTASGPAASSPARVLKFPGLTVDLTNRRIVMATQVCQRKKALELLVCRWDTKEHESILHTKASGANLHAGLLALGLTSGIPAHWSGQDETAKFIPPRGPELEITLQWNDKDGKVHHADASDWLAAGPDRKAATPKKWIFVGSDITPAGTYLADDPNLGHLISVSNFPDAVIDVPFESTSADADLEFVTNTEAIPPMDTDVDVIIQPVKDAEKSPFARVLLEIDSAGQLRLEGKPISVSKLTGWAERFNQAHPRGQVVIRAEDGAKVFYIQQAQMQCRLGGLRDFREEYVPSAQDVLPLTQGQLDDAMKDWKQKFSSPGDYIVEPSVQAQAAIQNIDSQLRQAEADKAMWLKYRQELAAAAAKYKASTQPGGGDAARSR